MEQKNVICCVFFCLFVYLFYFVQSTCRTGKQCHRRHTRYLFELVMNACFFGGEGVHRINFCYNWLSLFIMCCMQHAVQIFLRSVQLSTHILYFFEILCVSNLG